MSDNVGYTPGTGATVSADEVTYSGDTSLVQLVRPVLVSGSEGSRTVVDLPGDNTNGLDVDVTRVSGNVTVVQSTAANLKTDANITNSSLTVEQATAGNLNATVVGSGNFTVVQATAGNLNATVTGSVSVSSLPALAAGTAQIGNVNISDGTNALTIDTVFNDAESGTVNHLDVAARLMAVNSAGTFDMVRASVTAFKCATYATAQTGTALWTPASGKAVVITALQIQSFGTTAGTCVVWFGASGDTTYTRNTDAALFDGEWAPSNTNKPGLYITYPTPIRGTADYVLRVTTTNAQSVIVNVFGYEI
jgi:hypothetical protein